MTREEWSNEFTRNIRIQLQRKHMTQQELAKKADISPITMTRYMKRRRVPTGDVISKFASILECSANELIPTDRDY